jgi:hypothetical protein
MRANQSYANKLWSVLSNGTIIGSSRIALFCYVEAPASERDEERETACKINWREESLAERFC